MKLISNEGKAVLFPYQINLLHTSPDPVALGFGSSAAHLRFVTPSETECGECLSL